jgi:hypothetical protein
MTLLMTTEELLAVLEDSSEATAAPAPERKPERRLRVVPPPAAEAPRSATAATPAVTAPVMWAPTPAAAPRPSLLARLYCVRHGHDPRPHRPQPHDEVVYRCLRCGRPAPPPQRV